MFHKHVLALRWDVRMLPAGTALVSKGVPDPADRGDAGDRTFQAAMLHLESLTDCLEVTAPLAAHLRTQILVGMCLLPVGT